MNTAALKDSWASVAANAAAAAEHFYATLFTIAPDLRSMFPVVMSGQREKLLSALGQIVSNVDNPQVVGGFVNQLGRDHRRFSVEDRHYPLVGRALLATLQRALGAAWTTDLARDWAAAYAIVADIMMDGARMAASTEPPWWDADIVATDRRTPDISVLTVRPRYRFPFVAGQSIAVETHLRPKTWRYLSPACAPRQDNTIEFHVRAVPGGLVSPSMVYQVRPGDTLRLGGAVGNALTLPTTSSRDVLLLASGTGLAPMRALVEQSAADLIRRRVTLIVGAATAAGLYDSKALRAMADRWPWLTVIATVISDRTWRGQTGSPDQVALKLRSWDSHDIYVCGPPGMVRDTIGQLLAAGHRREVIRAEWNTNQMVGANVPVITSGSNTP